MPVTRLDAQDRQNYEQLMVALEASQGKLDLLIAVCDSRNLQEQVIQHYRTELQQQQIAHYRILVQRSDPSLRLTLEKLLAEQPNLQAGQPGVVTVQGIDDLLAFKPDSSPSQQERFLGYLQWTREAFRKFHFPVVIWMPSRMVTLVAEKAPDFWSWRGGVFWFGQPKQQQQPRIDTTTTVTAKGVEPDPAFTNLLHRIEQLTQQEEPDRVELASLYEKLGQQYNQRLQDGRNRQFAIQAYQRAVQLQTQLNLKADLADSLETLGNLYFELKDDVPQAQEYFQQALSLYRELGDRIGEANTLKAIADVLQFQKQQDEALATYRQALDIFQQVNDRFGEADTLRAIAHVLQFQKHNDEALVTYRQALGIFQQSNDRFGEANTLKAIADVLKFQTQHDEALATYRQALSIFQQTNDYIGEANTLKAIADVFQFQNQHNEALATYRQALSVFQRINDRMGEANTLLAIAHILQFQDQQNEILGVYQQALDIFQQINDRLGEANTLKAIADVLQFQNQRDEALVTYQQALDIFQQINARLGEANTLQAMGVIEENLEVGLEYCDRALEIHQQNGDQYSQSRNLIFFTSQLLWQLHRYEAAQAALLKGLELARTISYPPFVQAAEERLSDWQQTLSSL